MIVILIQHCYTQEGLIDVSLWSGASEESQEPKCTMQVAASAVETTGSKAALKAAFGILMTADAPKVSSAALPHLHPQCYLPGRGRVSAVV